MTEHLSFDPTLGMTVEHVDAGATIQSIIRNGELVVASYLPGTKHEDKADEIADEFSVVLYEQLKVFYASSAPVARRMTDANERNALETVVMNKAAEAAAKQYGVTLVPLEFATTRMEDTDSSDDPAWAAKDNQP